VRIEGPRRRRRWIDLAPLVDIVFLLLVFFMLATRFDRDRALPLDVGASAAVIEDEATLDVWLGADGRLELDGRPGDARALARALADAPGRRVAVRPEANVSLARIHAVLEVVAASEAAGASLVRSF
jgi:biopolymer transport protein ExbD